VVMLRGGIYQLHVDVHRCGLILETKKQFEGYKCHLFVTFGLKCDGSNSFSSFTHMCVCIEVFTNN
jgi:hypothetical protein